jgi:hypothetical protein
MDSAEDVLEAQGAGKRPFGPFAVTSSTETSNSSSFWRVSSEMRVENGQNTPPSAFSAKLREQAQPPISLKRISFSRQFQTAGILIPLVAVRLPWMVFI